MTRDDHIAVLARALCQAAGEDPFEAVPSGLKQPDRRWFLYIPQAVAQIDAQAAAKEAA